MHRIPLTLTALLTSSALFTAPAFGQDAGEDVVIAVGQYLSFDEINSVKTPTLIIDVPQSLSIVSDIQIKDQGFTSIGDILRYTPGLSTSQGEGHRDAIIIRGNQSTADFFIDGVRDDVQYFRPLYNARQVEILRGSNALLFGRGGVGGIINRVQKSPELGEQFTDVTASVNSFGGYSVAGDTNLDISETAGLRVNGFYEHLANHRDFYDGDRFGLNPTVKFDVTPQTTVNLSYEYLNDDRVVDRGVPSVSVMNGPDVPLEGFETTFFGSPDDNLTTLEANIFRGRITHDFSDMWSVNITAQYADYDKLYQNIYPAGFDADASTVTLDGYQDTTARENVFVQGNLVGEFNTGNLHHTLLIGTELGDQDTANARNDTRFADSNDDQITTPFADPLNIPSFTFGTPARDRASSVTTASLYIQDQIDLTDHLILVLGARFDSFDIDVDDIAGGGQFSRKDEEITPRLGAIYKPAENVSIYAGYSETFLPRSGDQFLTLNLDSESTRPQFTENREVGLKWDIRPDLSLTTAIFQLDRESFTSVDPNDASQIITIEGARTTGFEIQLTGQLTEQWFMTAGYGYLDGQVKDIAGGNLDGNKTRQTPENMFSIWNNYQLNEKLGLAAGLTYQDSFFVREDNAVQVPGFTRVDAAAYYDLDETLRLQLNIENLFDTDYFPDAHSNDNISTGAPAGARVTVAKRF
mgnify:CR=1 FL=1